MRALESLLPTLQPPLRGGRLDVAKGVFEFNEDAGALLKIFVNE